MLFVPGQVVSLVTPKWPNTQQTYGSIISTEMLQGFQQMEHFLKHATETFKQKGVLASCVVCVYGHIFSLCSISCKC